MSNPIIRAWHLGDAEPNTPEWYKVRRSGITATDLPQILGLSKYGNARSVWHDKRGELPKDDLSEAGQWGHLLEDVVAQEWSRRYCQPVSRIGVLGSLTEPWQRASCDRIQDGRNAALEVKTRSAYVAGKWRDDIPDDVLAQVAWQRLVGQFDYVDVACLIGGQQLTSYRYEKDSQLEDYLTEAGWRVWDCVLTGEPPPVDMDAVLIDLLDRLFPDRSGIRELDDLGQAVELVKNYSAAQLNAKLAEEQKDSAKAAIMLALGEAEVLTYAGDDAPLFTYREQARSSVSLKDLEDNDVELYEKVLAGGHVSTTTSRVLRAGKGSKNVT
jgi:putative phage-type endonuclease